MAESPPLTAVRPTIRRPVQVLPYDRPIIVTIDGPAGTGKSSVARTLAARLGLDFLDTGAMYRAAAAIAIDRGIDFRGSPESLLDIVTEADLSFDWSADPPTILAWGHSVADRIRDTDVTAVVSPIAGIAPLRSIMVEKQRAIAQAHPRLVTEGRDQGSVAFPDAAVKLYLDASPEVRCQRRAQQLRAMGRVPDEASLLRDIIERDKSDASRAVGPLRRPPDATVVDTSNLTFEQVVQALEKIVRDRVPAD